MPIPVKKLYTYYLDCGRMGSVNGLFIATDEEIAEAAGKRAYFGEILGKHSEVWDDDFASRLTVKTDDQDFITKLGELLGASVSGYNPLDYVDEDA